MGLSSRRWSATTRAVYPEASSVHDGRLLIGGCDAVELAREFGATDLVDAYGVEAETAATLGISAGSVKTHLQRGLAAMESRLSDMRTVSG